MQNPGFYTDSRIIFGQDVIISGLLRSPSSSWKADWVAVFWHDAVVLLVGPTIIVVGSCTEKRRHNIAILGHDDGSGLSFRTLVSGCSLDRLFGFELLFANTS